MWGTDGIDDHVERLAVGLVVVLLRGGHVVAGSQAQAVFLLGQAVAEYGDFCAHGRGDLHRHVTEATHAHHTDA